MAEDEAKSSAAGTQGVVRVRMFQVNAFVQAGQGFTGNPAGVCVWPAEIKATDALLQAVAAEVNCSETSFLLPVESEASDGSGDGDSDPHYRLRWFTPTTEVPLCGHGTLAAAGLMFYHHKVEAEKIVFHTLSGEMVAYKSDSSPRGVLMQFPRNPVAPVELEGHVATIARLAIGDTSVQAALYSPATKKLFLRLKDGTTRTQLEALRPDVKAMLAVKQSGDVDVRGVSVTMRAPDDSGADFMCRYFTPWNGIDEDPVNGSSHTNLTPYWSGELGKKVLVSIMCSQRSGRLSLRDDDTHVMIGGDTYLARDGALNVPVALIPSDA